MIQFLSFLLALYLLANLLLYVKQRDILYFPTPQKTNENAEVDWLEVEQHRLKIWKINHAEPAIIYFGGNSEAVEDNIGDYSRMFQNYTVYIVNYRGFGGSTGSPTEQALFTDALAIYDHVKKRHRSISVIGRSLGSGVASYLASKRDVFKLVLVTPYDSIGNVAQSHYPLFPVKWLIKDKFDSIGYAPFIHSQIQILYAENDQVVPHKHTRKLLQALPQATAHMISGSAHNTISSNPEYQRLLAEFMQN